MKNNTNGRLLAQTWSCRPYQDNYEELMKLCEENGSKPGDVLRDAFDEWLSSRRVLIELFSESTAECDPDVTTVSSIDNLLERIRRDGW